MKKTVLANGLEIISESIPTVESVTLSVFVGAGSYQESRYPKGIAHFLEHMMFKGTKKRNSHQINLEMDNIGGYANAYTDREVTKYYNKVSFDQWKVSTELLLDMVFNSTFPENELEKERQVILEEIKMYKDDPSSYAFDVMDEMLHPGHPERLSILGSPESVSSITRNDLISFMEEFYQPNNLKFVATGNINHEELVSYISSFPFSRNGNTEKKAYPPIVLNFDGSATNVERELQQANIVWATKGPSMKDEDATVMNVIINLLSGGMSSRLFKNIREDKGLAYEVQAGRNPSTDTGIVYGFIGTDEEKSEVAKQAVREELKLIASQPVSDEELAKGINYTIGTFRLKLESPDSINEYQGRAAMFGLNSVPKNYVDKVKCVTKERILEVASKYFDVENMIFVKVGPKKEL